MKVDCLVVIDEGTTSTRVSAITPQGGVVAESRRSLDVSYPRPGWVEQDAHEIWEKTHEALVDVVQSLEKEGSYAIAGLCISNQRETTVMWDRRTGRAVHPAIVWQCRRTADVCHQLKERGHEPEVVEKTGLPIDPYFSGTKMAWLLDHVEGAREKAERGDYLLGTVDTWLLYNLTGGAAFQTDLTNASRTQLLNIETLQWDSDLCLLFGVPVNALAEVRPSGDRFGVTRSVASVPDGIPIVSMIGDSQAALFGETAFLPGMAKATYGTGTSVMINTGAAPVRAEGGLATAIAWQVGDEVTYAIEGIIHTTGAAINWLKDGVMLIEESGETERLARSVEDTGGVYFVPAFTGLGTPWWDADARGLLIGITAGTRREHIVRAALDAIALQVYDVFATLPQGVVPADQPVFCGGGASRNAYLMQLQADLLDRPVVTCSNPEASSFGAAFIGGLTVGLWQREDLVRIHDALVEQRYEPRRDKAEVDRLVQGWHEAVRRAAGWAAHIAPQ